LAKFIRKRDPRYKAHLARQAQAATQKPQTSRVHNSGSTTPARRPLAEYVEQEWQKVDSRFPDDLEWANAANPESEEWECVACGKVFKSEAAWDSHERSKKHLKEIERLRKEMHEDNEELGLGSQESGQERMPIEPNPDGAFSSDIAGSHEKSFAVDDSNADIVSIGEAAKTTTTALSHTEKETSSGDIPADMASLSLSSLQEMTETADNDNLSEPASTSDKIVEVMRRGSRNGRKGKQKDTGDGQLSPIGPPEQEIAPNDGAQSVDAGEMKVEMSKREKRRAREARKAQQQGSVNRLVGHPLVWAVRS
jgi:DnaJ family protein A protein 5